MALKKSELYASLWKSCDELRGGMDASQYKDYVLVPIDHRLRARLERPPPAPVHPLRPDLPGRDDSAHAVCQIELVASAPDRRRLFQATCRVNRLDGYDKENVAGLLDDQLKKTKEDLDEAREAVKALCEPVASPWGSAAYQH